MEHYESLGGVNPMQLVDAIWVVREHKIEYLLSAFANEEIEIRTCGEYAFHLRVYFPQKSPAAI